MREVALFNYLEYLRTLSIWVSRVLRLVMVIVVDRSIIPRVNISYKFKSSLLDII